MLETWSKLDPTVQVAVIGVIGTALAGIWAIVRVWLQPKTKDKEEVYGPKPVAVVLSESDLQRFDRAISVLDNLVDTIERVRVEISLQRHNR